MLNHPMKLIDPKKTSTKDFHQFLLGSVAPRPIAFVSTLDENGVANLAPYSFFNAFSSNPPLLIFSSNRRVSDNTTKDTLRNVELNGECVINMVNYKIARQMAIASVNFPSNVSEFDKAGLTPIPSKMVKPFRVLESPAQLECRVTKIMPLGDEGGAGNLVFCEVLCMHIEERSIDHNFRINPKRMDLMGRMGRAYYLRSSGPAISTIVQPVERQVIGFDSLPRRVVESKMLKGNEIAKMAGLEFMPSDVDVNRLKEDSSIKTMLEAPNGIENLERYAKQLINFDNDIEKALMVMLLVSELDLGYEPYH